MQEAKTAEKHYFSPKLDLHASLKMVQNPTVSSSLPRLYFLPCLTWSCSWDSASCSDRCETGLGAIRDRWIRPAGRDLEAGMHLPHWDSSKALWVRIEGSTHLCLPVGQCLRIT